MANRQLVDYVREQLSNGFSLDQVRTLLVRQGWSERDVQAAVQEAYGQHRERVGVHHTHFVGVAVAAIVVLLLGVTLFLLVFRETEPAVVPNPVPVQEPHVPEQELFGWRACADVRDSVAKDTCYQELTGREEGFDCDVIEDRQEQWFCRRAEETVILARYASVA